MSDNEIKELLDKYTSGTASPEEINLCNQLFNKSVEGLPDAGMPQNIELVTKRVWNKLNVKHKTPTYTFGSLLRYAAAIIAVVGLATLFALYHNQNKQIQITDIQPGGNKATLTLANGQKIVLDAHSNGKVATISGGVSITNNNANGVVIYTSKGSSKQEGTNYVRESDGVNTISTPVGGQYHLVLSDGTRVFLNATSSLKFPSCFAGSLREVTLQGEAYFEVAKNPKKPFRVYVKGQQLTVTGTKFNVSAYDADTVKTTLAEGGVTLLQPSTNHRQPLFPNQQAVLLSTGFFVKQVNIQDEIAWKDGLFIFRKIQLKQAMKQICRWYNVQCDYSALPNVTIEGELSKTLTLNHVLNILNYSSDLQLKLEGGQVISKK